MTPEGKFQKRVIEAATRLGWRHYHAHDPRRDKAGFPDLVMVRRGRLIFAELKRDKKAIKHEVSKEQDEWLFALMNVRHNVENLIRAKGAYAPGQSPVQVFLWCPDDFDQILEALK